MAKQTVHIVTYGYWRFAFKDIGKAADAVKFFSKLESVSWNSGESGKRGYWTPEDDSTDRSKFKISIRPNEPYEPRKVLLALPATKRGTVPCPVCESVSVRPGTACESCGHVVAKI